MGTPIVIDEPYHGDDCLHFDVPAETPETIYVYFWDMIACPLAPKPPPNMHLFTLTQDDAIPCLWEYENVAFGFKVILDIQTIAPMSLVLYDNVPNTYFEGRLWAVPAEHQVYTALHNVCFPGIAAHHGYATLFWKEAAVQLINDMSLPTESRILFEFFMTDAHKPVYKFCFPKYGMNVKILLSP